MLSQVVANKREEEKSIWSVFVEKPRLKKVDIPLGRSLRSRPRSVNLLGSSNKFLEEKVGVGLFGGDELDMKRDREEKREEER